MRRGVSLNTKAGAEPSPVSASHPVADGFLHPVSDDVVSAAIQAASRSDRCGRVSPRQRARVRVCVLVVLVSVVVVVQAEEQQLPLRSVGSLQERLDEHLQSKDNSCFSWTRQ